MIFRFFKSLILLCGLEIIRCNHFQFLFSRAANLLIDTISSRCTEHTSHIPIDSILCEEWGRKDEIEKKKVNLTGNKPLVYLIVWFFVS